MQTFPSVVDESGTAAYWENPSKDGGDMNIGYWLTGTGEFSNLAGFTCVGGVTPCIGASPNIVPADLSWAGNTADGTEIDSQPQAIQFQQSMSATQVTINAMISALTSTTELGWYDVSTGTMHPLFDGAGVPGGTGTAMALGATAQFTAPGGYYFYLTDYALGSAYFMDSVKNNGGEAGRQHFAVFSTTGGTFYVGAEDDYTDLGQGPPILGSLTRPEHMGDFNDVIFSVSPVLDPVPEPSMASLCGFGLLGLFGLMLRRRQRLHLSRCKPNARIRL